MTWNIIDRKHRFELKPKKIRQKKRITKFISVFRLIYPIPKTAVTKTITFFQLLCFIAIRCDNWVAVAFDQFFLNGTKIELLRSINLISECMLAVANWFDKENESDVTHNRNRHGINSIPASRRKKIPHVPMFFVQIYTWLKFLKRITRNEKNLIKLWISCMFLSS